MLQNLGSKSYLLTARANLLGNSTAVSAAVDLEDYEGDTEGGTYTDMTGGGFTTTGANTALQEKIFVNSNDMKRFIKVSTTVAGGTGTGFVSVVALAAKKYD